MKFIALLALTLSVSAFAKTTPVDKVIYGQDDRLDIFESNDNLMKELSLSTAVQILNRNLVETTPGQYTVKAETLAESGMCKNERFANQPTAGNCSGFLVAGDKLVTAGHCINSDFDCQGHYWVFDFANKEKEEKTFTFNKDQVYRCSKIIERKKDSMTQADYAVVKLSLIHISEPTRP